MSRTELEALYSAIEESAGLMDVDCSRDKIWPILTAFEDIVPEGMIAFRVANNKRHKGEFDCRISLPKEIDPYDRALSNGLITETGHPIDALLSDIKERCPIDSYGIDFGVVGGFKKIWAFFSLEEHQELSRLVEIPSMPRSLAKNVSIFSPYGLWDRVGLIGIDYHQRTVNVYFSKLPDECREPKNIVSMHHEIGLPDPSEQMVKFCEEAFGIYATLSWDSPKVERISFSVVTDDPMTLPIRLGPEIEQFLKSGRYGVNDPKMVHAAMTSTGEEYYKLQSYYKWRPHKVNLKSSNGSSEDLA